MNLYKASVCNSVSEEHVEQGRRLIILNFKNVFPHIQIKSWFCAERAEFNVPLDI